MDLLNLMLESIISNEPLCYSGITKFKIDTCTNNCKVSKTGKHIIKEQFLNINELPEDSIGVAVRDQIAEISKQITECDTCKQNLADAGIQIKDSIIDAGIQIKDSIVNEILSKGSKKIKDSVIKEIEANVESDI